MSLKLIHQVHSDYLPKNNSKSTHLAHPDFLPKNHDSLPEEK